MKIGLGVKIRESSGETMTLSTLCGAGESTRGMEKRNVERTHDEHAQGTSQEPSACYQNRFKVSFVLLWHFNTTPTEHEPERGEKVRGKEWRQ